jgi:hypothetical protein
MDQDKGFVSPRVTGRSGVRTLHSLCYNTIFDIVHALSEGIPNSSSTSEDTQPEDLLPILPLYRYGLFLDLRLLCVSAIMGRHKRKPPSLVSISHNAPWYEIAGIKSDLPPAPCAWLQFGSFPGHELIEPYICASLSSRTALSELGPWISYSQPREKSISETYCGLLNYDLIRSWINISAERHIKLCGERIGFKRQLLDIKLIDVRHRRIVRDSGDFPYATLSYVWAISLETTASTSEPELSTNNLLPR